MPHAIGGGGGLCRHTGKIICIWHQYTVVKERAVVFFTITIRLWCLYIAMPTKRCGIPGCERKTSLHRLPKDPDDRNKWIQFIFKECPSHVSTDLRVCSLHFTIDCFKNKSQHDAGFAQKLLLKERAVPTVLESIRIPQTVSNAFIYIFFFKQ